MKVKDNIFVNEKNQPIYFNMDILEPWTIDDFFKLCCEAEHGIVTKVIDEAFEYWNATKHIRACFDKFNDLNQLIEEVDKITQPFDLNLIDFKAVNGILYFEFCITNKYKYLFSYLMLTNIYKNEEFCSKYNLIINGCKNKSRELLISHGLQILKDSNNE